jgi:hypothetical protein
MPYIQNYPDCINISSASAVPLRVKFHALLAKQRAPVALDPLFEDDRLLPDSIARRDRNLLAARDAGVRVSHQLALKQEWKWRTPHRLPRVELRRHEIAVPHVHRATAVAATPATTYATVNAASTSTATPMMIPLMVAMYIPAHEIPASAIFVSA